MRVNANKVAYEELVSTLAEERSTVTDESPTSQIKRRKRLTYDQKQHLLSQFNLNPNWSMAEIEKIAAKLGMQKSKVYKWNWD